jgi:Undecaprenyl-phosphate glucose phosphotransferase
MIATGISADHEDHGFVPSTRFFADNRKLVAISQMVVDFFIITAASVVAFLSLQLHNRYYLVRYDWYIILTTAVAIVYVSLCASGDTYKIFYAGDQITAVEAAGGRFVQVILLSIGCLFLFKVSESFSRLWLIAWSSISVIALASSRVMSRFAIAKLIRNGVLKRNIVIVGASQTGRQLVGRLMENAPGARLAGLFDQRNRSRLLADGYDDREVRDFAVLGDLLSKGLVDEVVIAIPPYATKRIAELSRPFHPFPVSVHALAPEGYEKFRVLGSCYFGDINTFRIMSNPMDELAVIIKWGEDKLIAACCLIFALPIMALTALAITLDSPGPILFKQKRLGANNIPFDLLKFRSMYAEQTDPLGSELTRRGDSRVTKVGRLLRRTSIDELPQLINVLRGEMSLVGPRPHALAASAGGVLYANAVGEYLIRHRVKPGITGWAQVNGWRGETTTIEQIHRRVEHDLYYVNNWSLALDLSILLRTMFVLVSQKNAV